MTRRHVAWTLIALVGLVVFAAAESPALVGLGLLTALIGYGGFIRESERWAS